VTFHRLFGSPTAADPSCSTGATGNSFVFDNPNGAPSSQYKVVGCRTGSQGAASCSSPRRVALRHFFVAGGGLMVNCLSDDNVIEGLEWEEKTGKPFLFCIQWHPERMHEFQLEKTALSAGIRNLFIEAIKKSK